MYVLIYIYIHNSTWLYIFLDIFPGLAKLNTVSVRRRNRLGSRVGIDCLPDLENWVWSRDLKKQLYIYIKNE